jgi:hypothetical protein
MFERRLRIFLPLVLLAASTARGQSTFATITGLITDPHGTIVPGAKVLAKQDNTNYSYSGVSNEAGQYTLANLLVGSYTVRVSAAGFGEYVVSSVQLADRDVRRIDAQLTVGPVSTAVTVSGGATVIETESARISDVWKSTETTELPTAWRRITDILPFNPQVNGTRFAGSRTANQANTTMDGVNISDTNGDLRTGTLGQRMESYDEVRVDNAGNSAEYATLGGLSIVTKGGGNQVHGFAFDYYMGPAFFARNPFSLQATGSVQHIPGGLISGPVYIPKIYNGHNKTFFLASLEFERFGSPDVAVRNSTVPLAAWRGGDFSGLGPTIIKDPMGSGVPFPGGVIPPSRLNPVSTKLQELFYPLPNFGSPNVFTPLNFRGNDYNDKEWAPTLTVRLDHRFSEKSSVFAGVTRMHWNEDHADTASTLITTGHVRSYWDSNSLRLGFTHIFNPSLLNEFRWGYASFNEPSSGAINGQDLVTKLGLTGLAPGLPNVPGVLNVAFNGLAIDSLTATSLCGPCVNYFKHVFSDQLSWFKGSHSVKVGADIGNGRYNNLSESAALFGSLTFSNEFSGFPYADFLLGIPTTAQRAFPALEQEYQSWAYGVFVTDTYRIRPTLTLTIGLRYEVKPPFTSNNGYQSVFDIGTGKIVVPDGSLNAVSPLIPKGYVQVIGAREAGLPESLFRTDWNNFAPRFALAWRPWGKNTVIRAGFGIFYDVVPPRVTVGGTPFLVSEPAFTNPIANPTVILPNVFPNSVGGPSTVSLPVAVNPNLRIPYSMQYNVDIEHQLGQTAVRLSYIGTGTRQGVWTYNINQPVPSTTPYVDKPRLFPNYPSITYTTNGAGHQYNSLAIEVKRQLVNGLVFNASYALSRDIGDLDNNQAPENAYDRHRERAVWTDIPTDRFVLTGLYNLPFGKHKRFLSNSGLLLNGLFGGWELGGGYTLQSADFLTPSWSGPDPTGTAYTTSLTPAQVTIRPDELINPNPANPTVVHWFNAAAFAPPAPGSFGTSAKGVIKGPGRNDLDLCLLKYFRLGERASLRVGAWSLNVANHPNYNDPATNISNAASVGVITSVPAYNLGQTPAPRTIELNVRLEW